MKAGYGESTITPSVPCPLTGYGIYLERMADSVLDDLKVRAVWLDDEAGNAIVLASLDLIGLEVAMTDDLRMEIAGQYGIAANSVMICCTHTHSGPPSMGLRGMGQLDPDYMNRVREALREAAGRAYADIQEAVLLLGRRDIEPIGFNRVNSADGPVDGTLGLVILVRSSDRIILANYSCHPVTLGPNSSVSADYPGRWSRVLEERGDRLLFLQGFCGNIDPLVNRTNWGSGTEEDMENYGRFLVDGALQCADTAAPAAWTQIWAVEKRVSLLYQVHTSREIEGEIRRFEKAFSHKDREKVERFTDEWSREARGAIEGGADRRFLGTVPVQVISIGETKVVGLPGEIFCELGIELKSRFPGVFTAGYAGGNVGYVCTEITYENPEDYACYLAPKFYNIFPFQKRTARVLLEAADGLIRQLSP